MPEGTRVHNCVDEVKAKGGNVNPYAVCQASTGQNFHTGKALHEERIDMASHGNDLTLERLANKGEAIMNNQKVHPNTPPIGDYLAPLPKVEPKTQHARVPAEPTDDIEPEENEVRGTEPHTEGQAQAITMDHHGEQSIQFCPHCGGHIGMDPAVVESEPLKEAAGGYGTFHPQPKKPGQLSIGRPIGSGLGQHPTPESALRQRVEGGGGRSGLEGGGAGGGESERRGMKPLARVDHPFEGGHR
jgi:hypothetical protein